MKKLFLIFLFSVTALQAFDAPVIASATVSSLCLKVLPDNESQVLEFAKPLSAPESGNFDIGVVLWNPQKNISATFPVTISFRVNDVPMATAEAVLTPVEADISTVTASLSLNASDSITVYATQQAGHPLTIQSFVWLVKQ